MVIMKKKSLRLSKTLKIILLVLVLFLATFRAFFYFLPRGVDCVSDWLTIVDPCNWINAQYEIVMWAVALILLTATLLLDNGGKDFIQTCKHNKIIFLFSLSALISVGWSIQSGITLYKAFVLFSVSLLAIYIGHTFHLADILKVLTLYFVFLTSINLLYVIVLPSYGISQNPIYQGAWRGLFWHRNYLGCFMALGTIIIFVRLLSEQKAIRGEFFLNLILLSLTSFLLLKSKSATAIITGLISIGLVSVLFLWTKIHKKMSPAHYYGFLSLVVAAIALVFSRLDFFLGFFGRNSTLTGRTTLWQSIYQYLISLRPWLGYGYGVIWHLQGIRTGLAEIVKWSNPVMIGDNGFVDIVLHLGLVGLVVLIAMIIFGFIRGIKYFLQQRTIEAAFPIILLIASILANITLSLILESESFIWLLNLILFVSITSSIPKKSTINF
jgi:exopolysaccharide production protein ExoQ